MSLENLNCVMVRYTRYILREKNTIKEANIVIQYRITGRERRSFLEEGRGKWNL